MTERRACGCCGGTGIVADIEGRPRPCSRCCVEAFKRWAERRLRPLPPRPVAVVPAAAQPKEPA